MADPITLIALTAFIVKHAPSWYKSLRGTILDKSREVAIDKGKDVVVTRGGRLMQRVFHLDEKEQLRHLEQALKNATERGLATFDSLQERDQYKDIVRTLSQEGPQGEVLRKEVMQLFTLSEKPDLVVLSDTYNQRQRFYNAAHQDIDVAPYLNSFFNALIGELYADPYFRTQLSDVLQLRATADMQQSLLDIVSVLKRIGESLEDSYSTEDFAHDVAIYTSHIERTVRNLKIVGVVPKDQNADPEISGIFVPLRIASHEQASAPHQFPDAIVAALEQYPYLVMLGGPGSGKSTATKHLAWSHAVANQSLLPLASTPLLSGNPLPLRIELRRLNEERKRANYDFLSFVAEVLLKREGVEINPQMFVELLKRRCMLLLFDGLDEVATLDERLGLVGEIEHFALCYPGNRVLVTSRPVGYDLARVSHPLFFHVQVQNFNDEQIQQFLENWYTAVLRLSPIPQRDQEELDLLLTTLKENPRLHKLAENPLLLTVITALHRYERLPDRRVLVYDRCADLLLEKWAELKGTDKRWIGMKMIKEEQYACVAYLAFLLHERSQEETSGKGEEDEDITVDVTSRFLRHNVEDFLKKRELIVGIAEQQTEAKLFIKLIQEEAGLIVERGTDENGEALYSFVHRTFQEYFAAADVYERYLQQEDARVISDFLSEHLHDPHWSEVILLLLGKLKSKPVTNQLRQILEGKIKSRRSCYTEIVQHDLFFVCDCLVEEIKVENNLVEMMISTLKDVVKNARFPSQQQKALQYLGKLMQTRLYTGRGKDELIFFVTKDNLLDLLRRLDVVKILYLCSVPLSQERQLADKWLKIIVQHPDLSVDNVRESAALLYSYDLHQALDSETLQLVISLFTYLGERPDLSVNEMRQIAESLYNVEYIPQSLEVQQLATSILTTLVHRPDASVDEVRQSAESLYRYSPQGSEAKQLALSTFTHLVQCSDLSVDQTFETAMSAYWHSPQGSEVKQLALSTFTHLVRRPDLSVDEVRKTAISLYRRSPDGSEAQQLALSTLTTLVHRSELLAEQAFQTAESFYQNYSEDPNVQQLVLSILTTLREHPDLSVDRFRKTAESFSQSNSRDPKVRRLVTSILADLVQRPGLSDNQVRQAAMVLYKCSFYGSKAQQVALSILTPLVERPDLSVDRIRWIAKSLHDYSPDDSEIQQLATSILATLIQRPDLSVNEICKTAMVLYPRSPQGSEARQLIISRLAMLIERPNLSIDQISWIAESLHDYSPDGSEAQKLALSTLITQVLRSDLSVDQAFQRAESLCQRSPQGSESRQLALSTLATLVQHPDLSVKEVRQIIVSLYRHYCEGTEAQQLATILMTLAERPNLSVDEVCQIAESLYQRTDLSYRRSPQGLEAQQLATSILTSLVKRPDLSVKEVRQIADVLYQNSPQGSEARRLATSMFLTLLSRPDGSEINMDVYPILRNMIPQFHNLPPFTLPQSSNL